MSEKSGDMVSTMVSIMRAKKASTFVVERAARVIAADARLSARFADQKKNDKASAGLFKCLEFTESIMEDCYRIRSAFENGMLAATEVCKMLEDVEQQLDGYIFVSPK